MFDFRTAFPPKYQNCFDNTKLLSYYLCEENFIHTLEEILYNCQDYYFHNNPDLKAEFMLAYRDPLIRALRRFEYRGISLENFLGSSIKLYRKNFFKNIKIKNEIDSKIYGLFSDNTLDKISIETASDSDPYAKSTYVAENRRGEYKDSLKEPVLKNLEGSEFAGFIWEIEEYLRTQKSYNKNTNLDSVVLIKILLVYNESSLAADNLLHILHKVALNKEQYDNLLAQRDGILQDHRAKKNELKRQLDHSYLKYLAEQRKEYALPQRDEGPPAERLEKLYHRLNQLRWQYLHMKKPLSRHQVGLLLGLPPGNLYKYYHFIELYVGGQDR